MKEDGAFGAGGWGGNKVRKLEWLIPDARRRGRRSILTFGGLGTNWGLATALYGREHGLATALALVDQPIDDHVRAQLARLEASGAHIHRTHTKARTVAMLPWLLARNARGGRPPYLLPAGGSSAVGALGYVEAVLEIAAGVKDGSLPAPAHVVVAVGTGGTATGLALGFQLTGLRSRVAGVVVNDQFRLDAPVLARLARRTATLLERGAQLGTVRLEPDMLDLTRDQIGAGYGHSMEATRRAALAAEEGHILDPVCTAKAMAGLLALREADRLDGSVLFVHTDGPRQEGLAKSRPLYLQFHPARCIYHRIGGQMHHSIQWQGESYDRDMADQVPAVGDVLTTIENRDWSRLERLLDPDVHWTTAVEDQLHGPQQVIACLSGDPPPAPPAYHEVRDGRIVRWIDTPG